MLAKKKIIIPSSVLCFSQIFQYRKKKKKEEEEKYVYQKEKKGNVIGSQMEFWGHKRTFS